MRTKISIKHVLLGMFMLASLNGLLAQSNPYYVCANVTAGVDLGTDVVGKQLHLGGGYWEWAASVTPTDTTWSRTHGDGSKVTNVFAVVGKKPGEYLFRYTATNNDCADPGEQFYAKVIVLPVATDKGVANVSLCLGETYTFKLAEIIDTAGVTVTYISTTAGTLNQADHTLAIGANDEGAIEVIYRLENEAATLCDSEGKINIQVIRSGNPPELQTDSIWLCIDQADTVLNLGSYISAQVPGGAWSTTSGATVSGSYASFPSPPVAGKYDFTYEWSGGGSSCRSDSTVTFVVVIDDELSFKEENADTLCLSDDPNGIYKLMDLGLKFDLPENSGYWTEANVETNKPPGAISMDVSDGNFYKENAKVGTYKFMYILYDLADLCGLADTAYLTLEIGDVGNTYDGRLDLCLSLLEGEPEDSVNLKDYVENIPPNAVFTSPGPSEINVSPKGKVKYEDIKNMLVQGTHAFPFEYSSAGCDENGEGNVYLSIVDSIVLSDSITLSYCRPDMAQFINLTAKINAEGISGTWEIIDNAAVKNEDGSLFYTTDASEASLVDGVFSEADQNLVGTDSNNKAYRFKFTTADNGDCISAGKETVVTILISNNDFY